MKVEGGRLGATVIRYIVLSRELSTEASLDTGSEVRQRFRWRLLDTRASNEGPKNTRRFTITLNHGEGSYWGLLLVENVY